MAQLARDRLLDAAEGINLTGHTLARGVSPEGLRAIREWPSSETLSELLEGLAHRTDDRSGKRS